MELRIDHIRAIVHRDRGEPLDQRDRKALAELGESSSSLTTKAFDRSTGLASAEDFDRLMARHKTKTVTFGTLSPLLKSISKLMGEAVRGLRADDRQQLDRIEKLETLVAGMESKMATGFQISAWGWKYEAGKNYKPGEIVQRNGIWCCVRETTAQPGSDPSSWKLIVHRSKVGGNDDEE